MNSQKLNFPSIAFFEVEEWELPFIEKYFPKNNVKIFSGKLQDEIKSVQDFEIISTFCYSQVNQKILQYLPQLKLVATRSTGYDHIDLEACKERKINVVNVPDYGSYSVAEHTFALILALSRNIHKAYLRTLKREFKIEGLKGFDLRNKTLGVIGTGRIGREVIKLALGFKMKVLAYDIKPDFSLAKKLNFQYVSFEEVLKKSDIISLHAPYTPKTHHLINQQNIKLIKKGTILINTARGGLVETQALLKALDEGILAGAGLDVLEEEDLIKEEHEIISKEYSQDKLKVLLENHVLMNRENVVITPHIAFYTKEALERLLTTSMDNIKKFIEGKPQNIII